MSPQEIATDEFNTYARYQRNVRYLIEGNTMPHPVSDLDPLDIQLASTYIPLPTEEEAEDEFN